MQDEFREYYKMIGLKVAYYRKLKGLTQEQTARILGVSQVQVSRLERRALARLRESL